MLQNYFSQYSFCALILCPLRSIESLDAASTRSALSRYLEIIHVGRVLEVMRIPRRRYLRYSNWNVIFGVVDECYFFSTTANSEGYISIIFAYTSRMMIHSEMRFAVEAFVFSLRRGRKRRRKRKRKRKSCRGEVVDR